VSSGILRVWDTRMGHASLPAVPQESQWRRSRFAGPTTDNSNALERLRSPGPSGISLRRCRVGVGSGPAYGIPPGMVASDTKGKFSMHTELLLFSQEVNFCPECSSCTHAITRRAVIRNIFGRELPQKIPETQWRKGDGVRKTAPGRLIAYADTNCRRAIHTDGKHRDSAVYVSEQGHERNTTGPKRLRGTYR